MKKTRKRLALHRETVLHLSGLRNAIGGTSYPTALTYCPCGSGGGGGGTTIPTQGESGCGTQEHTACTTHTE